ncbi:hypothetical protein N9T92_01980 [Candidatus Pelagibacter sp.]|nr:hypothetical protein [Candidatus Pelagibacter sp.]
MFSAKIITITFLSSFFGIFIVDYLENKPQFKIILKTFLLIIIIFSIYNLIAGLNLWFGWEDPLSKATPEQMGRTSARRGGGLVLLIISFWPYILILAGAYWTWIYFMIFRKIK